MQSIHIVYIWINKNVNFRNKLYNIIFLFTYNNKRKRVFKTQSI